MALPQNNNFDSRKYLQLRAKRLAAQEGRQPEAATAEASASSGSGDDSFASTYLKLRRQRMESQGGNQAEATGSDADSFTATYLKLRQQRLSGQSSSAQSQGASTPEIGSSGQANTPFNTQRAKLQGIVTQGEQIRKQEAEANAQAQHRDQQIFTHDMNVIQNLSEEARSALETYAQLNTVARNHDTQHRFLHAQHVLQMEHLSKEQMDALAETLRRSKNAESMQKMQSASAQDAEENPILHNILSVPAGIAGAISGAGAVVGEAVARAGGSQYSSLDPNLPGYQPGVYTGTVRQTTTENIDDGTAMGKAGAVVYGATMSAVDNLARILTLGPTGSLAFAGMSSFQDSVRDVASRGGTPAQAYAMGVATAGLEVLTEKVSLDSLISTKTPGNIVQLLKNAAIQGGIEVSEEELNFAGGLIADAIIMGHNSDYNRTVADLVEGGMSTEDAKAQAFRANLYQAATVAAQSFLSGGMMSGGQAALQTVANGGFSASKAEQTNEQFQSPAQPKPATQPVQPPQTAPAQPVQAVPQGEAPIDFSSYVAPDGLRYEDMTPVQKQAAYMQLMAERRNSAQNLKNKQAGTATQTDDANGIRDQIRKSQNQLNNMQPVTTVQLPSDYSQMNKSSKMNWVIEKLRPTGYQVDRKGFGIINFAKTQLKAAFKYFDKGSAEEASFEALPYVLESGVEIHSRDDHKGRSYGTVTIAAPVIINGKRGNMAVVVKRTTDNFYKVHRILTPDGSVFLLNENTNEAESTAVGELPETGSLAAPKDSASEISISENNTAVKSRSVEPTTPASDARGSAAVSPDESVGAAPQGFDPYTNLQYQYGNQPDRPGDFRPVNVPKRDTYGRQVTAFAANAYGSEDIPDSFIPIAEQLIVDGALGFDSRTNAESLDAAAREIDARGMAKAKADITKAVTSGKIGENDIAKAMLLFTHYANKGGTYAQDAAAELFVDLSQMATRAGRDLQLFKLLRKMTPQGQLQTVVRKVDRFVEQTNKSRSHQDQVEVDIPQALQEEFENAAQEAADAQQSGDEAAQKDAKRRMDEAEQAIYAAAASQIPSTLQEKWDAWRYLAMLGNPKTQIRNILGNAVFRPFVSAKRFLNAAAQSMLKPQDRTVALLGYSEADNALRAFAAQDAVAQEARMEYTGTTGDSATTDIGEKRQIFDNEALEFLRTKLSDLMGAEDMFFKRVEYRASLASYLKAKGVTAAQLEAGECQDILEAARSYAVQEAMKATFNDRNALSNFVVNLRYKGNNPVGKAANILGEGILPFRRTPANIIVRGLEYNPANFLSGVTNYLTKVRTGEMPAADAIDQMSSGLVGTGAIALGYALASGIFGVRLVGTEDNEDELRAGHQSYALEFGNISYTVDWAAPSNLPLFMGTNLYNSLNSEDRNTDVSVFTAFLDAVANTLEPMLELSCLSSLNDLFQDIRYADEDRELYAILVSSATNYLLQCVPTLLGQIEQATESEKKSIYAESTDPVVGGVQRFLGRATQKIPGVDLYQTSRLDEWGNPERKDPAIRAMEALVSPGYSSQIDSDAVEAELSRLNLAQDLNVSPASTAKTVTVNGEKTRLTADQWAQMQTTQGQTAHRIISKLIASPEYNQLSNDAKAAAIRSAYDYAREHARVSHVENYTNYSAKWMEGIEGKESKVILDRALMDASGLSESKYNAAAQAGMSLEDMQYIDDVMSGLTPEAGKTAVRDIQRYEAIVQAPKLTDKEEEAWLKVYFPDSMDKKLDIAQDMGYSADQFVAAYRAYLDNDTRKADTIAAYQEKFGMSYEEAKALYEIYK